MSNHASVYQDIYMPYDQENYPEMNAFFGERMPEIEACRVKAAEMLATLLPVGQVIGSSLPSTDEAHKHNPLFLVDTADNQRFMITGEQVRAGFTLEEVSPGNGKGRATFEQESAAKQAVIRELGRLANNITFTSITSEVKSHGVVNIGVYFTHLNDYGETSAGQALCRFRHKDTEGSIIFPNPK